MLSANKHSDQSNKIYKGANRTDRVWGQLISDFPSLDPDRVSEYIHIGIHRVFCATEKPSVLVFILTRELGKFQRHDSHKNRRNQIGIRS